MKKPVSWTLIAVLASLLAACAETPQHEATGQYFDDSLITAKVKAAIVDNPILKSTEVHVDTAKGVVALSGFVESQREIAEAGTVAAGVDGVKSIRNELKLK